MKQWKTWKRIVVGQYHEADQYMRALTEAGCQVAADAGALLREITYSTEFSEVELVRVSVAELGFTKPMTRYDDVRTKGHETLDFCLPEDGPALRLAYRDQPKSESLYIVTAPRANYSVENIFGVSYGNELHTDHHDVNIDYGVGLNDLFVFRKRKIVNPNKRIVIDEKVLREVRARLNVPEEMSPRDLDLLKKILDGLLNHNSITTIEYPPIGSTVYESGVDTDMFECVVLAHHEDGSLEVLDKSLDVPHGRKKRLSSWHKTPY